jgi:dinuclear metal center YbgI/SA1388 family protein
MFANGQTVIQLMEQLAPKRLAMNDDKIGLQLGTLQKSVKRVMIALDVTAEVVAEAIERQVDVIIAHHAIIFRPLTHLRTDTAIGKLYETLIKHDIAVYIAHTNLDIVEGGVNDLLADALQLEQTRPLDFIHHDSLFKLTVFVPHEHADNVRSAMFAAGAGYIEGLSHYSHCSFHLAGQGTFLPLEGAKPAIGAVGTLAEVEELRIECVVSETSRKQVVQAMIKAHPYEEVAYDLVKLENEGAGYGLGRVGTLQESESLQAFSERVKQAFGLPALRVCGPLDKPIRKVAVLGGSGGRYAHKAKFQGVDVFVTGDIDHHTALDALAEGLAIVDAGHHIEQILKPAIARRLHARLEHAGYQTQVIASQTITDPFQFV